MGVIVRLAIVSLSLSSKQNNNKHFPPPPILLNSIKFDCRRVPYLFIISSECSPSLWRAGMLIAWFSFMYVTFLSVPSKVGLSVDSNRRNLWQRQAPRTRRRPQKSGISQPSLSSRGIWFVFLILCLKSIGAMYYIIRTKLSLYRYCQLWYLVAQLVQHRQRRLCGFHSHRSHQG